MGRSHSLEALQKLGIESVINASGRMTRLGVNTLSEDVFEAMAAGGRSYVDIEHLHRKVGEHIARRLGAEDAMVTTGAAAGVSLMVAACVAGDDLVRVQALPDAVDGPRQILIQSGHQVNFGADINQMVRIGGGRPTSVGAANQVHDAHLFGSLTKEVVAFLYVQSHHAVQKGMLPLDRCIEICHERGVPVIVDAAAEEDLKRYTSSGADLVTFSGGKAIGGPTSGIIAGSARLIQACRAQNDGIGRPMKVGKEQLLGLAVALDQYFDRDQEAETVRCSRIVDRLIDGLSPLNGIEVTRLRDEAGRGIERVGIVLDSHGASELVNHLVAGTPAIYPRTHLMSQGIVALDPRPLGETNVDTIVERVRSFYTSQED